LSSESDEEYCVPYRGLKEKLVADNKFWAAKVAEIHNSSDIMLDKFEENNP
jgi:hypothetical protein